jgi:hypothetical protein
MRNLDLVSPTRNENYTVLDVLKKGSQRAALTCENFEIELLHTCFYGSRDYAFRVQNLESSQSLWADSVNLRIDGMIPVHATADGKLSIGFGCGCDTRHGGQFPSEADPDNENWADYQDEEVGQLTAWLAPGDSSENVDVVSLAEVLEDEECRCELLYIVKDLLSRAAFGGVQNVVN